MLGKSANEPVLVVTHLYGRRPREEDAIAERSAVHGQDSHVNVCRRHDEADAFPVDDPFEHVDEPAAGRRYEVVPIGAGLSQRERIVVAADDDRATRRDPEAADEIVGGGGSGAGNQYAQRFPHGWNAMAAA